MFARSIPRAAVVLVSLGLWACASPSPVPIEVGHPAHPQTAPAPETTLRVLSTYRDFAVRSEPPGEPARDADEPDAQRPDRDEESGNAHEH